MPKKAVSASGRKRGRWTGNNARGIYGDAWFCSDGVGGVFPAFWALPCGFMAVAHVVMSLSIHLVRIVNPVQVWAVAVRWLECPGRV